MGKQTKLHLKKNFLQINYALYNIVYSIYLKISMCSANMHQLTSPRTTFIIAFGDKICCFILEQRRSFLSYN